eukprot:4064744-Amphidinium_carterae.2
MRWPPRAPQTASTSAQQHQSEVRPLSSPKDWRRVLLRGAAVPSAKPLSSVCCSSSVLVLQPPVRMQKVEQPCCACLATKPLAPSKRHLYNS